MLRISQCAAVDRKRALDPCPCGFEAVTLQQERDSLGLCVCLVDSNVPPQQRDAQLLDWLRSVDRHFVVVATKIDRLSGNERTRNLAALRKGLEIDDVLPVSAKTGAGLKELWARIEAVRVGP